MFGLQNLETRKFEALYFHAPKTAGTHMLTYVKENYAGNYAFRTLHGILPFHDNPDLPIEVIASEDNRYQGRGDHAHLTIDQAFDIYPSLDDWIQENNINVFTMVRDPYERFVSCLRFLPILMRMDMDRGGKTRYREQFPEWEFHQRFTNLIMSPQANWVCRQGVPYAKTLHLNDISGKVVKITDEVSVDFSTKWWTNEDAAETVGDYVIPKFELDDATKKFVQWFWKEDFELGL